MKNLSFGEQGIPTNGSNSMNQGYSQGVQHTSNRVAGSQYPSFEQYNTQHKNQQYLNQHLQQQQQAQQQQLQQQSFQGQNQQQNNQLVNSQSQQFYSVLSNSYLSSQQFPDDQVQFMESKDSGYQQRTTYNPNLKLSQQQLQQQQQQLQQQQQQQQVEQEQEIQNNSSERQLQQQQQRQNQLLQQRLQDQQIQGEVHEVEEEEDDENNYNSHIKNNQEVQQHQNEQGEEEVVLRREYNEEDRQEQEEEEEEGDQEDEEGEQGQSEGEEEDQGEEGEEAEEGEEDVEIYECMKCGNLADQALMMECKHHLCLNCAAYQYTLMLKKSQIDQSQDLIQSLECENCGTSTPLPESSVKVLLEHHEAQVINGNLYQNQQQRADFLAQQQKLQQDQFYHQQQQQQQQFQQQQKQIHLQNIQSIQQQQQQFYGNNFQQQSNVGDQNFVNRQNQYQHQQLPSFSNKQNFNNSSIPSPQQIMAANFLQDNQFQENVKASKQKKKSSEGLNKGSQNQSQNQSLIDKSNDETILYCFTCESLCFSLDEYLKGLHKNHNVNNVSKGFESLQEPIDDLRFKIKTRADLLIQDDARLNKKKKELGEALEQCKSQINKSFEDIIIALQQKQQELLRSAEECIEEKFDEINKGINKVSVNLAVLEDFDKNLEEVYYKSERVVPNEIRAFNHYSENKTKILETIQQMDTNLFHTIRDKVQYEFQLDINSLTSHIDSIKRVKVEIFRLKGLETPGPNRLENKFFESKTQEKSKKLLEHIIQQHANATSQARVPTAAHEEGTASQALQIQTSQQQQLLSSQSFIHHSNIFASPSSNNANYYLSSNVNNSVADIFNTHKPTPTSQAQTNQLSPGRYIKIKVNGTAETTANKRFHSPTHNISSNNQRKIKLSPSGRDLNVQKSMQLSNSISLHGQPQYKTFSLTSQSTKQVFNNILNSPSSIVKKYTPQYEKLSLQPKETLFSKQNQSTSNINTSKVNIFEQIEHYKKNIEEIRKQGQFDENNLNSLNSAKTQPTTDEQASIAAQNRIRQLQEKLSTKFC